MGVSHGSINRRHKVNPCYIFSAMFNQNKLCISHSLSYTYLMMLQSGMLMGLGKRAPNSISDGGGWQSLMLMFSLLAVIDVVGGIEGDTLQSWLKEPFVRL